MAGRQEAEVKEVAAEATVEAAAQRAQRWLSPALTSVTSTMRS
jgi:hypothetical protein